MPIPSLAEQQAAFIAASESAAHWLRDIHKCWEVFGFANTAADIHGNIASQDDWFRVEYARFNGSTDAMWKAAFEQIERFRISVSTHQPILNGMIPELLLAASLAGTPLITFFPLDRSYSCAHQAILNQAKQFFVAIGADEEFPVDQPLPNESSGRYRWHVHSAMTRIIGRLDSDFAPLLDDLIFRERDAILRQVFFREVGPLSPDTVKKMCESLDVSTDARWFKRKLGDSLRVNDANSKEWFVQVSALNNLFPEWFDHLKRLMDSSGLRTKSEIRLALHSAGLAENNLQQVTI